MLQNKKTVTYCKKQEIKVSEHQKQFTDCKKQEFVCRTQEYFIV